MLANVIEMAYWLVKFVGDYGSFYSHLFIAEKELETKNSKTSIISKTVGSLVKFIRYFMKYFDNHQKLIRGVKRGIIKNMA